MGGRLRNEQVYVACFLLDISAQEMFGCVMTYEP